MQAIRLIYQNTIAKTITSDGEIEMLKKKLGCFKVIHAIVVMQLQRIYELGELIRGKQF